MHHPQGRVVLLVLFFELMCALQIKHLHNTGAEFFAALRSMFDESRALNVEWHGVHFDLKFSEAMELIAKMEFAI